MSLIVSIGLLSFAGRILIFLLSLPGVSPHTRPAAPPAQTYQAAHQNVPLKRE
jgi:hypothetical protein